jgi:predicted DNA-binding antitoxin AbrB/MazE fold protein
LAAAIRTGTDGANSKLLREPKRDIFRMMSVAVEAIYEGGQLRLLNPLPIPEHARVRVSVELMSPDSEREAWLKESERRLIAVWENDADEIYNELLSQ